MSYQLRVRSEVVASPSYYPLSSLAATEIKLSGLEFDYDGTGGRGGVPLGELVMQLDEGAWLA